ncbi:MAG: flagellar basal body rod protein FlgB [Pseudomonadaceae bacterium]|nr:MAG: flagellar basal body rod protein FlgB [Pseudomonadaceae bacterium]
MSLNFDRALGVHEQALKFRAERASVLSNNLANADTPNFKARDLDFQTVLQAQKTSTDSSFRADRTHAQHLPAQGFLDQAAALRFRTPSQPAIDGNTVDTEVEKAKFAENAIDFQASFTFLDGKFKGLMTALRGE